MSAPPDGVRRVAGAPARRAYQALSERRSAARLEAIGASGRPVVLGPWLSEVGFELLYWIPLLRRALGRRNVPRARVTVVTRGGAGAWYRDLAAHEVEIFDVMAPGEFRERNAQRARARGQKQLALTDLDAEILRRAGDELDPEAELVHPSLLYGALRWYWSGRTPAEGAARHLSFAPLPAIDHPAARDLPARFTAVKAYHSDAFPDDAGSRRFAGELVRRLSAERPVVVLSAGAAVDDHADAALDGAGVIRCDGRFAPRDNLAAQTAILARSDALFCSYGGFSYLGPFCGVPTVPFATVHSYNPTHLEIARRAARELGAARELSVADAADPDEVAAWPAAATVPGGVG